MAKDPAFLFYPGDVLQEIALMNNTQKGVYLMLMCYLHKNTCISYDQFMIITTGTTDDDKRVILSAMTKDAAGNFYIEWLRTETERRKKYSKSRAANRAGTKKKEKQKKKKDVCNTSTSYVQHMETETEAENEAATQAAADTANKNAAAENPQSLHYRMRKTFLETYERKTQLRFSWDAKSAASINYVIPKIKTVAGCSDDQSILTFWTTLLDNLPAWYVQHAFTPATINSKFNELINQIRTPHATNNALIDRQLAEIAAAGSPYGRARN